MKYPRQVSVLISLLIVLAIILINQYINLTGFLGLIARILLPLFYGLILAWILNPVVNFFESKLKNRKIALLITGVVVVLIVTLVMLIAVPIVISQVNSIIKNISNHSYTLQIEIIKDFIQERNLDGYFNTYVNDHYGTIENMIEKFLGASTGVVTSIFNFIGSIFSFAISTFVTVMVTIYLLVDFNNFRVRLFRIIPSRFYNDALFLLSEFDAIVVAYFKSYAIISFIVFVLSFIFFSVIGLKSALLLALIVGITNFIPYFGPFIGAIPPSLMALTYDWHLMIVVIVGITIIQQIDANILKPRIIGKSTFLGPVSILMSIIIFGDLWGIIGIVIAIPLMSMLKIVAKFTYYKLLDRYPSFFK